MIINTNIYIQWYKLHIVYQLSIHLNVKFKIRFILTFFGTINDVKSIFKLLDLIIYNILVFKRHIDKITFAACQRLIMVCKSNHKGTKKQIVKVDAVDDALVKGPEVRNCLEGLIWQPCKSQVARFVYANQKDRKNFPVKRSPVKRTFEESIGLNFQILGVKIKNVIYFCLQKCLEIFVIFSI